MGYVWVDQPSASYDPMGSYTYNSIGGDGSIHMERTSKGLTRITFGALGGNGGNVQVTGYGENPGSCNATRWFAFSSDEEIHVACRDESGALVDAHYGITFTRGTALRGTKTGAGAYFVADKPAATSAYQPDAQFRFSTSGHSPVVHRLSKGTYQVVLTGIAGGGGSAQVTGMSDGAVRCNLGSINPRKSPQQAVVRCADFHGSPTDSKFSFMFTR